MAFVVRQQASKVKVVVRAQGSRRRSKGSKTDRRAWGVIGLLFVKEWEARTRSGGGEAQRFRHLHTRDSPSDSRLSTFTKVLSLSAVGAAAAGGSSVAIRQKSRYERRVFCGEQKIQIRKHEPPDRRLLAFVDETTTPPRRSLRLLPSHARFALLPFVFQREGVCAARARCKWRGERRWREKNGGTARV